MMSILSSNRGKRARQIIDSQHSVLTSNPYDFTVYIQLLHVVVIRTPKFSLAICF